MSAERNASAHQPQVDGAWGLGFLSGMEAQSSPRHRGLIHLDELVRLRAGAIGGQLTAILAVHFGLDFPVPLWPLLLTVAVEAFSNVGLAIHARRAQHVGNTTLAAIMASDVLLLTTLLYFSGGPHNPFSFLYLVQIALAAIVLPPRWTWALLGLSLVAFGSLFLFPAYDADRPGAHAIHMRMHLQGMWVAFGVAASFITAFLYRITRALAETKEQALRSEKLASLATLAAGAAHELSTPLSTIAVVAKELERTLAQSEAAEDAKLIRAQVERCRGILLHLAADAGASAGEAVAWTRLDALVRAALEGLPEPERVKVTLGEVASAQVRVPSRAVAQALRGVLKNALTASQGKEVHVEAELDSGACRVRVRDCGEGMPSEVLARAGEPFFTTKPAGLGMGLGLFLAREVLSRLGGSLTLSSTPGVGTTATLSFVRQGLVREGALPT